MNITADAVKQLRERTGAGMMECKKALVETKGDLDAAAELMRKTGPRQGRQEGGARRRRGRGGRRQVRRCPRRRDGGDQLRNRLRRSRAGLPRLRAGGGAGRPDGAAGNARGAGERSRLPSGESIDERRRALVAKIGENISVRRFARAVSAGASRCLRARHAHRRAGRGQGRTGDAGARSGDARGGEQSALPVPGAGAGRGGGQGARDPHRAGARRRARSRRSSPGWSRGGCARR